MKKLATVFFSFIMLLALISASTLLIGRTFFEGDNMATLLDVVIEEISEEQTNEDYIELFLGSDIDPKIKEYLNDDELKDQMGDFVSEFILYMFNVENADKPNLNEIKEYIETQIDKYEEDTGNNIDTEYFDEYFNDLETELDTLEREDNKEITMVFSVLYSNSILIGAAIVIITCLVMVYVISRDIRVTIRTAGIVTIINGLCNAGLGKLLNLLIEESTEESITPILEVIVNLFNKAGIYCIIAGIILIIVSIILKKKTGIDDSNKAIENLDQSVINNPSYKRQAIPK